MPDIILTNATLATMTGREAAYGLVEDGAVALRDGRIAWFGKARDIPADVSAWDRRDLHERLFGGAE